MESQGVWGFVVQLAHTPSGGAGILISWSLYAGETELRTLESEIRCRVQLRDSRLMPESDILRTLSTPSRSSPTPPEEQITIPQSLDLADSVFLR